MVRSALPNLENTCNACKGSGVVGSLAWEVWLDRNPHPMLADAAIDAEDPPPQDARWRSCERCSGVGTTPTKEGMEVLDLVMKRLHQHSRDQYLHVGKRNGGVLGD